MRLAPVLPLAAVPALSGEWPRTTEAFRGKTPALDSKLSPGEYGDAVSFTGVSGWTSQFSPTTDPADLPLKGRVKHDGRRLYFAFDVTDDLLYAIDIPRRVPQARPKIHNLTREGFPWFGDEMELLINATNSWQGDENARGDGTSGQMACDLTKSRLGGIGKGGLPEGEPRRSQQAWDTYQRWITTRAMEAAAVPKSSRKGYIIEWAVRFNPCLEVEPGRFYSPAMGDRPMGINIALGDLDEMEKGAGNFANFHHEDWFAGEKNKRTQLRQWGTLWIRTSRNPAVPRDRR